MTSPFLFNRTHLRQQRLRAQKHFGEFRFLHDWCEQELAERLDMIRRTFPVAVISPLFSDSFRGMLKANQEVARLEILKDTDEEILDLEPGSIDLIVSMFDLHAINDLPGMLAQMRRALKPDGLFIACMPGGETLHELRQCLMDAELELNGGASIRVFPFVDKQQMGALMQRAGFSLPVVDSDILNVSYPDILRLMKDLKGMGEGNVLAGRRKGLTGKALFALAGAFYADKFPDRDGRIGASFEIISLIGWAPHASQQQPQKRGSGQVSLETALNLQSKP